MKKDEASWIVIHIVHSAARAEEIVSALHAEGFLIKTRPVSSAVSNNDSLFEILALASEAKEARNLLLELGI